MTAPQDVIVDLSGIKTVVDTLLDLRVRKAEIEEQERTLTEIVKNALGAEGSVGQVDGETVVTYRETTRRAFDQKQFRADVGDHAADKYMKTSTVRSFRFAGGAR